MENIIQTLLGILNSEDVALLLLNVKIIEDKDGNIQVTIKKPQPPKEVTEFKNYIDTMDDDIFEEAAKKMKVSNPESFNILTNQDITKLPDYIRATQQFKAIVRAVAAEKTAEIIKVINEANRKLAMLKKYTD